MTKRFSLQTKITELETIEKYFQEPDMDLEAALKMHKEALQIAQEILAYLQQAESTLEQIDIQTYLS